MDYEILVLDKLLDKYEKRVSTSNHRVLIDLKKKDVKVPDIESSEYIEFREAMIRLKNKNFIDADWIRKDYIIKSVWLNLNSVDNVYQYLERPSYNSKSAAIVSIIETSLQKISTEWIRILLGSERDVILSKGKITGISLTPFSSRSGTAFSMSFFPVINSSSSSDIFKISHIGINSFTLLKSFSLSFHS